MNSLAEVSSNTALIDLCSQKQVREVESRLDTNPSQAMFDMTKRGTFENATKWTIREVSCMMWTARLRSEGRC